MYLPPDPASRTSYVAGEIAQCDLWFPPITLPVGFGQARTADAAAGADDGRRLLALAVGGADPVPHRRGPVRRLVAAASPRLGAVPRVLVWDGEGAVGRWRGGRSELTARLPGVPRHAGREGADLQARATRRPRAWSSGPTTTWSARSCPAARSPARPTSTPSCSDWLALVNTRPRRALGCAPTDRIAADRAAMLAAAAGRAGDRVADLDRGWPATTTSGWTATTTRCTRR